MVHNVHRLVFPVGGDGAGSLVGALALAYVIAIALLAAAGTLLAGGVDLPPIPNDPAVWSGFTA